MEQQSSEKSLETPTEKSTEKASTEKSSTEQTGEKPPDRRRKTIVDHMEKFRFRKSSLAPLAWQAFRPKTLHVCAVNEEIMRSRILPTGKDVTWYAGCWNSLRNLMTISEYNPRSTLYYRSQVDVMKMKREHLQEHPFIIHPFSIFRIFYEMYLCCLFLTALVVFPIGAAFNTYYLRNSNTYSTLDTILSVLCFTDVFVNFITGYAVDSTKVVILDPMQIAKHYVTSINFYCDIISSTPDMSFATQDYHIRRIIDVLGLLRISRLPSLIEYINRMSDLFKTMNMVFRIVKYLVVTYLTCHWFACVIFLVPQIRHIYDENPRQLGKASWIKQHRLKNGSFADLHIGSMYVASAYLLCIEIKKVKTWTEEDMIAAIFTYLFGKIFVMFLTVILLQLLLAQRSLEAKYQETISQVKAYMRQKQLPAAMRKRLLHFYEYRFAGKFFREEAIGKMLSDVLKKEINIYICQNLVRNVNLFASLPSKSVEDILAQLTAEIFLPNDLIIKANTVGECMYFLAKGTVTVSTPSGREVCHLEDGAYFGEISLVIKDKKRTANITALEICEVYRLDKRAFRNIFYKYPELLRILEDIANKRLEETQVVEDSYKHLIRL